jgi:hypothetical protein
VEAYGHLESVTPWVTTRTAKTAPARHRRPPRTPSAPQAEHQRARRQLSKWTALAESLVVHRIPSGSLSSTPNGRFLCRPGWGPVGPRKASVRSLAVLPRSPARISEAKISQGKPLDSPWGFTNRTEAPIYDELSHSEATAEAVDPPKAMTARSRTARRFSTQLPGPHGELCDTRCSLVYIRNSSAL